jgi:hypothetical protein
VLAAVERSGALALPEWPLVDPLAQFSDCLVLAEKLGSSLAFPDGCLADHVP